MQPVNIEFPPAKAGWQQSEEKGEAVDRKNVQCSYKEENARKHYGRRNYDRAHMRQMQKTNRKDLVHD